MAADIAALLASTDAALDLIEGTNLFVDFEPKEPDACVTVYNTGGAPRLVGPDLKYPTVQVRVRGARTANGRANAATLAEQITTYLHDNEDPHPLKDVQVNGSRYLGIMAVTEPINLGEDEYNRAVYTVNFSAIRTSV